VESPPEGKEEGKPGGGGKKERGEKGRTPGLPGVFLSALIIHGPCDSSGFFTLEREGEGNREKRKKRRGEEDFILSTTLFHRFGFPPRFERGRGGGKTRKKKRREGGEGMRALGETPLLKLSIPSFKSH